MLVRLAAILAVADEPNGRYRLPSGGWAWRGRLPPSGDRWLRASGGYGRQVATGDGLSEHGAAGS
jgi:hypothetical protein